MQLLVTLNPERGKENLDHKLRIIENILYPASLAGTDVPRAWSPAKGCNYECEASLESTGHRYMDASLDKASEGR